MKLRCANLVHFNFCRRSSSRFIASTNLYNTYEDKSISIYLNKIFHWFSVLRYTLIILHAKFDQKAAHSSTVKDNIFYIIHHTNCTCIKCDKSHEKYILKCKVVHLWYHANVLNTLLSRDEFHWNSTVEWSEIERGRKGHIIYIIISKQRKSRLLYILHRLCTLLLSFSLPLFQSLSHILSPSSFTHWCCDYTAFDAATAADAIALDRNKNCPRSRA